MNEIKLRYTHQLINKRAGQLNLRKVTNEYAIETEDKLISNLQSTLNIT